MHALSWIPPRGNKISYRCWFQFAECNFRETCYWKIVIKFAERLRRFNICLSQKILITHTHSHNIYILLSLIYVYYRAIYYRYNNSLFLSILIIIFYSTIYSNKTNITIKLKEISIKTFFSHLPSSSSEI